jgi:hypothetical protein
MPARSNTAKHEEDTVFSAAQRMFSQRGHTLLYKKLSVFKIIDIIQSMSFNDHGTKLGINDKEFGKETCVEIKQHTLK